MAGKILLGTFVELHEHKNSLKISFRSLDPSFDYSLVFSFRIRTMTRNRLVNLLMGQHDFTRNNAEAAAKGLLAAYGSYGRGYIAFLMSKPNTEPRDLFRFISPAWADLHQKAETGGADE